MYPEAAFEWNVHGLCILVPSRIYRLPKAVQHAAYAIFGMSTTGQLFALKGQIEYGVSVPVLPKTAWERIAADDD